MEVKQQILFNGLLTLVGSFLSFTHQTIGIMEHHLPIKHLLEVSSAASYLTVTDLRSFQHQKCSHFVSCYFSLVCLHHSIMEL